MPLVLADDLALDRPQDREVRVRVAATGVCRSDLHFRDGQWTTFPLPLLLGHECAGVVEEVGRAVTYIAPGDHVVGCLTAFCGECRYCLTGRMFICEQVGLTRSPGLPPRISRDGQPISQFVNLSSFAEQMLVHERALVKIDDDIPLDVAAVLGCAVTTGLGAVVNTAQVRPGETVAVVGCGGIGLNIVQGARLVGAGRIIAVDVAPTKLASAKRFGATDLVRAGDGTVDEVTAMTAGGVDHAFEAVGRAATAQTAFKMLAPGGTATIVGMLPQGESIRVAGDALLFDRRLRGSNMGSNRFRVDIPRYLALYRDGRLLLDELISARIDLSGVNAALDALAAGGEDTRCVALL